MGRINVYMKSKFYSGDEIWNIRETTNVWKIFAELT